MTPTSPKRNILEFFEITRPFFKTDDLKNDDLKRFVNREKILKSLQHGIEFYQNAAVIGKTGTGKSSILHKFRQMISESHLTCHMYFSTQAKTDQALKEELARTVLQKLLKTILENDQLLDLFKASEIDMEVKRLDYTISTESFDKKQIEATPEIELNFGKLFNTSFLPVDLSTKLQVKVGKESQKSETITYSRHDETTIKESISKITARLPQKIVFFIDEMDVIIKSNFKDQDWILEVQKILQSSLEFMINPNLIFIFALQYELYDIFSKALRGEGDDAILKYIPVFCHVTGFDLPFAKQSVEASLAYCGYKGKITDLFGDKVIEIVLEAVKNNPRLFMLHLGELTKEAHNQNETKVTIEILKEYLEMLFGETGPEAWRNKL